MKDDRDPVLLASGLALYEIFLEESEESFEKTYAYFLSARKYLTNNYFFIYSDPSVSKKRKDEYLKEFLEHIPNIEVLREYFSVLYKKQYLYLFYYILKEFLSQGDRYFKKRNGIIYTNKVLKKESLLKIENFFSKKLKISNLKLFNEIKKEMSHGIILEINDKIFDYTISSQIEKFKRKMLN